MVFDDAGSGRSLRFGVVCESAPPPADWLGYARRVEDVGVDVLLIRDHFVPGPFGRQPAPWTALAAAAAGWPRAESSSRSRTAILHWLTSLGWRGPVARASRTADATSTATRTGTRRVVGGALMVRCRPVVTPTAAGRTTYVAARGGVASNPAWSSAPRGPCCWDLRRAGQRHVGYRKRLLCFRG